jgi:hypothetical protein
MHTIAKAISPDRSIGEILEFTGGDSRQLFTSIIVLFEAACHALAWPIAWRDAFGIDQTDLPG